MLKISVTNSYERDMRRIQKRGKDLSKLYKVVAMIAAREQLPPSLSNHKLHGDLRDRYECHIEPDWLLMYKIIDNNELRLERTVTHSDLF